MGYDMHIHTEFSRDSKTDIEEYFIKAKEQGLDKVCFTDHIDFEIPYYEYKDDGFDYPGIITKAEILQSKYNITPVIGAEIGYRKSLHQRVEQLIAENDFKVVMLSVHQDDEYSFGRISKHLPIEECVDRYLNQLHDLVTSEIDFDIVTHIDFVFRYFEDKRLYLEYEAKYREILKEVIKREIVLEFNTASQYYFGNMDFYDFILRIYQELGGKLISLGSDSHDESTYCFMFDEAKRMLKKYGFEYTICIDERKRKEVRI